MCACVLYHVLGRERISFWYRSLWYAVATGQWRRWLAAPLRWEGYERDMSDEMIIRDKLYIGGAWTPSSGSEMADVINSTTEEVMGRVPRGTAKMLTARCARRKTPSPRGRRHPWPSAPPICKRSPTAGSAARRRSARSSRARWACPSGSHRSSRWASRWRPSARSPRILAELPVRGAHRQLAGRARADRRRRLHHAVELPAAPDRGEGGAGAGRGLHRRPQAERGRAAQRVHAGRDRRRRRAARRRLQPGHRARARSSARRSRSHPDVDMISFTGSTGAGRRVSELAVAARSSAWRWSWAASRPTSCSTTPTCETAVRDGVGKCFLNSGQTCSALTRMLVPRSRLAEVEEIAEAAGGDVHAGRSARRGHAAGAAGLRGAARHACASYIARAIEEGARW